MDLRYSLINEPHSDSVTDAMIAEEGDISQMRTDCQEGSAGIIGLLLFAALFCIPLSGCSNDDAHRESAPPACDSVGFCGCREEGVEARISDLLSEMTLSEKLDQMHGIGLVPVDGLWQTADNERLGIPGFRMVDGPRGVGVLAGTATAFPVGMARGATWDVDLEEQVGEAIGREVRGKGGSVLLAPTLNILSHPRWGRAQETYGEDPYHLGGMGVAFIRGAQRHVVASAKHYALNNIERTITVSNPVIRGFSGRNLLALIDRNTLSTLWGEGGNAGDDMCLRTNGGPQVTAGGESAGPGPRRPDP